MHRWARVGAPRPLASRVRETAKSSLFRVATFPCILEAFFDPTGRVTIGPEALSGDAERERASERARGVPHMIDRRGGERGLFSVNLHLHGLARGHELDEEGLLPAR